MKETIDNSIPTSLRKFNDDGAGAVAFQSLHLEVRVRRELSKYLIRSDRFDRRKKNLYFVGSEVLSRNALSI